MKTFETVINLPQYIQVIIATGYIGYIIARRGFRDQERKDELFYGVMVFGLIGYGAVFFMVSRDFGFLLAVTAGFVAVIIAAVLWRKVISRLINRILHVYGVSNEDGTPSVWVGLMQNTSIIPTQISLKLKNGERLECEDVRAFNNASIPRFYADNEGNIALYVTHRRKKDGEKTETKSVSKEGWGDRLTYVKNDMIETVSIRYKKK